MFSLPIWAQTHEIGLFLGASNYHGDLADEIVLSETHASAGIFYRHNFNKFWAYKPMLSYMRISGSDENFEEYRLRNLSFRSDIFELSNTLELNFQPFSNSPYHQNVTFYAFTGFALYYHNPKTKSYLNDEWLELPPMHTEGQDGQTQYKNFQLSIPFGGGFKYALAPNFIACLEVGWRRTFTDYLDDVSTIYPDKELNFEYSDRSREVTETNTFVSEAGDMRGDPNLKDWYLQAGITLSYRFIPIKCWPR